MKFIHGYIDTKIDITLFSSLSGYVHNLDNLPNVSSDERQALDLLTDELYEEMDRGESVMIPLA